MPITPEQIKDVLPVDKVYEDTLRPAMKQVGLVLESVAKTARLLSAPIAYVATFTERLDKVLNRISEKVKDENLIEGQPQLVVPTLEGLSLAVENSLLSALFINLLANSVDKTKQDLAHPAFPNIIKQLSHDEAVILYYFKKDIEVIRPHFLPIMNDPLTGHPRSIHGDKVLQYVEHLDIYLDHLISLNLVESMEIGGFWLSGFGKLFAEAAVPDEFPEMQAP